MLIQINQPNEAIQQLLKEIKAQVGTRPLEMSITTLAPAVIVNLPLILLLPN